MQPSTQTAGDQTPPQLIRGVGLSGATALNMIDMIGVGPFITMPLIVSAMGGPQAMLGWILGALFAMCDGLVWAELGAAMPGSGGSYRYLKEIYGPRSLGRLISFLFIWQLSFSAPLSIASGCIGLSQYAAYFWPGLEHIYAGHNASMRLPLLGSLQVSWLVTPGTFVAIVVCIFAVLLLYRRITSIGRLSKLLWIGVMGTIGWIIFAGLTHFNSAQAFGFPPGAVTLSRDFFNGLGGAMLIAAYDYWGYYNVCFLGDEIKEPGKTIPRALLLSILLVAGLYILMNISILAVVPWQDMVHSGQSNSGLYVVSVFMQRIYGLWAAREFARVHPQHRFPYVSLLALGGVAAVFCFLRLADVIAALVVIRIMLQFLIQAVGVIVLRVRRPELPRPFRMWLYPLPALIASFGFIFILISRKNFLKEIRYAAVILIAGLIIYLIRAWRGGEWPFGESVPAVLQGASSN